jgi:rod shape-determining protein MreC
MLREFLSRRKNGATFIALVLISTLLTLASSGARFDLPKAVGLGLFSTVQRGITGATLWFRATVDSIGELRRVREELEVLRERLAEAERISRDIVRLRRENEQLRELVQLSERSALRNFPAQVIGKQPGNTAGEIILDKGSRDGVRRLMPVVAQQRGTTALVGKVVTVSAHSCAVLPITGRTSFVAARMESSRYDGLLAGQGEISPFLLLTHVSTLAVKEIGYGDVVVTSGLGQLFPADVQIGRVRTVRSLPQASSLEVEVEPFIDVSRLEHVLILDAGQ